MGLSQMLLLNVIQFLNNCKYLIIKFASFVGYNNIIIVTRFHNLSDWWICIGWEGSVTDTPWDMTVCVPPSWKWNVYPCCVLLSLNTNERENLEIDNNWKDFINLRIIVTCKISTYSRYTWYFCLTLCVTPV